VRLEYKPHPNPPQWRGLKKLIRRVKSFEDNRFFLPSFGATLYPHLLEKGMIINRENENGLKGQQILAQGKQSVALGWRAGIKIVRTINIIIEKVLFRTREMA